MAEDFVEDFVETLIPAISTVTRVLQKIEKVGTLLNKWYCKREDEGNNPADEDGCYWVDNPSVELIPRIALRAGTDQDGADIFVGRAFHEGDLIPAKVVPSKDGAYVTYDGEEIPVQEFQVLCEPKFEWIASENGDVPEDAVVGGQTSDGENLYIGRVSYDDTVTVGKVHPSHGSCYVPFDGKEVPHESYEVLVLKP